MSDIGRERLAAALHRLVDDLAAERGRNSALRRENRELRAEMERLLAITGVRRARAAAARGPRGSLAPPDRCGEGATR